MAAVDPAEKPNKQQLGMQVIRKLLLHLPIVSTLYTFTCGSVGKIRIPGLFGLGIGAQSGRRISEQKIMRSAEERDKVSSRTHKIGREHLDTRQAEDTK